MPRAVQLGALHATWLPVSWGDGEPVAHGEATSVDQQQPAVGQPGRAGPWQSAGQLPFGLASGRRRVLWRYASNAEKLELIHVARWAEVKAQKDEFLWFYAEFVKISCCCLMCSFHRMLHRKDWKLAPGLWVSQLRLSVRLLGDLFRGLVWFSTLTGIERQSVSVENDWTVCSHTQKPLSSQCSSRCMTMWSRVFVICQCADWFETITMLLKKMFPLEKKQINKKQDELVAQTLRAAVTFLESPWG